MYTLVTFPRSGAHYFQNYVFQSTGYKIDKTHEPLQDVPIVTIARNPIDSVASMVGMITEYNKDIAVDVAVNKIINNYENFYRYLDHHASLIFDYEDLVNSPEKVAESFANFTDLEYRNINYIDDLSDMISKKHVKTSTSTQNYLLAKDMLINTDIDLNKANDLFYKVLSNKVDL